MNNLLTYLKQNPVTTILAPLFKMLEAVFELLIPLIVARMIDRGIGGADSAYLLRMGGLMVLLGLVGFASSVTAQYFAANSAVACGTAMRSDLFRHIQSLSFSQIDTIGTAQLITHMTSDINLVQTGVNMFLRLFLRSPFIVFGAVVMAFLVDTRAAVPFGVVIPILFAVVFAITFLTIPLYRAVQDKLDQILHLVRDNLRGVRVVRAFAREQSETQAFHRANDALCAQQVFTGKLSALLNPLTYVLINLGIAWVLLSGGRRVQSGQLTQGQVVALVNYMSQILVELIKFANLIVTLSRAAAGLKRVSMVFALKNPEADGTLPYPDTVGKGASLTFDHVTFSYPDTNSHALSDISFSIEGGQTLGIIGATGSGKSTLAGLAARFYRPEQGSILLNHTNLNELREPSLRRAIGVVPQKAALVSGTLRDNLRWADSAADDETMLQALDIAQASEFVRDKGAGLDLEIAQNGQNLSGGQRQRLTIARALTGKPSLLILDDSASALDFATDAKLRRDLRTHLKGRTTMLLIAQRVSTVREADRILVLDGGAMAGYGTHQELLNSSEIYREICRSQMSAEEYDREIRRSIPLK